MRKESDGLTNVRARASKCATVAAFLISRISFACRLKRPRGLARDISLVRFAAGTGFCQFAFQENAKRGRKVSKKDSFSRVFRRDGVPRSSRKNDLIIIHKI